MIKSAGRITNLGVTRPQEFRSEKIVSLARNRDLALPLQSALINASFSARSEKSSANNVSLKERLVSAAKRLADLYNIKKLLKNLAQVKKEPTLDGINSVVSAVEGTVWRIIGTAITAATTYLLTGAAWKASAMILLDIAIKGVTYLVADKAIQKLHRDEQIPLKSLFAKIALWRAQGSFLSGSSFTGLSASHPELLMPFLIIDAAIKLPLHTAWALTMRSWAHRWKLGAIPEYAEKYRTRKKSLLGNSPDYIWKNLLKDYR